MKICRVLHLLIASALLFASSSLHAQTEYEWHRDPTWDPFAEIHRKPRQAKP